MQHNEYALHRVTARITREVRERDSYDDSYTVGKRTCNEELRIVAPAGELGIDLVRLHLKHTFKFHFALLEEIVSHEQQPLHAIVRYDDAERGRM